MGKTKVIFRKTKLGEIVALFPNDKVMVGAIWSYKSIYRHRIVSSELINDLEVATAIEFVSLLRELGSIGYKNLDVRYFL